MVEQTDLHQQSFDLLKKLVENQCENFETPDSGNEMKSVQTLIEFFDSHGIMDYEVFEPHPTRASLLVRAKGTNSKAPSIMFQSHLDVVPAEGKWTRDPFICEIIDDWI